MEWRPASEAIDFRTYLTKHDEDLFPVCAFRMPDGTWMREVEGPEDIARPGALDELYRPPTHIMDLEILPFLPNPNEAEQRPEYMRIRQWEMKRERQTS